MNVMQWEVGAKMIFNQLQQGYNEDLTKRGGSEKDKIPLPSIVIEALGDHTDANAQFYDSEFEAKCMDEVREESLGLGTTCNI